MSGPGDVWPARAARLRAVEAEMTRESEPLLPDSFPSVEEMVRTLYARPWGECEAGKRRVLEVFLTEWSRYSGEPLGVAKRRADALVAEVEQ